MTIFALFKFIFALIYPYKKDCVNMGVHLNIAECWDNKTVHKYILHRHATGFYTLSLWICSHENSIFQI